jgi:hypothetical protein
MKREWFHLAAGMTVQTTRRTKRLVLRPFEVGDVADALSYRDDKEFARFLPHIPQPFTRDDVEAFVTLNISEPWDRSPTFAVVLGGRVIGTVNLEVNTEAHAAMLGYAIGGASGDGVGHWYLWLDTSLGVYGRPPPSLAASSGEAGYAARGDSSRPPPRP